MQPTAGSRALAAGDAAAAGKHLEAAAACFRDGDFLTDLATVLTDLADYAQATGDLDAAERHAAGAITIAAPRGLVPAQSAALAARAASAPPKPSPPRTRTCCTRSKWGDRRKLSWWDESMAVLFAVPAIGLNGIQAAHDQLFERFRADLYVTRQARPLLATQPRPDSRPAGHSHPAP